MRKIITPKKTFVYYDGPELFLAADQIGTRYICLLIESSGSSEKYLCSPISAERLTGFVEGLVDLRDIYSTPETEEFYSLQVSDKQVSEMALLPLSIEEIPETWLPDPGFIYEKEVDSDQVVVQEAHEKHRAVVHLALNPPESRGDAKISAETLGEALKIFQNLVKYAYRKAVSNLKTETKRLLEAPDNFAMEVFRFSEGSFRIHFQSKTSADLAGYSELFRAMEKIDEIVHSIEDPGNAIDILKKNKGHLIGTFKKFLKMIIEVDTPLYYEWSAPNHMKSFRKKISREQAIPIYEMLLESKELDVEQKAFEGNVIKADVVSGQWTIFCEEDNKGYHGKIDKDSNLDLNGIVLGSERYRFICEERMEEETVSGREKTILSLISYEEILSP